MSALSLQDCADANVLKDIKARRKIPYNKMLIKEYCIDYMENYFTSMFDYKNFPASLPKEFAEKYFIYQGSCAIKKIPARYNTGMYAGETVFLSAQPSNDPDVYGQGSKVIVTSANGYNEIIDFTECSFAWNNSAHTSLREFIIIAADAITNAFLALRSGVRYSKTHPIFKASDDKEIAALNKFWQDICNDEDSLAITSENVLEKAFAGQMEIPAASNVINLSDPTNSDKLQYLIDVCDNYIRIFMSFYGQCIQGNAKRAQQTVDEVNGHTSASFILPNDMLAHRQAWVQDAISKGLLPEDAEIDFSSAFKVEEIKYQKEADIDGNGEIEDADINIEETATDENEEGGDNDEKAASAD